MDVKLTIEGEQYWQELRQHLDWNNGFALFFYFSDSVPLSDIFRSRLERFFVGQMTKLQQICYEPSHPDWVEQTMGQLLLRDERWRLLKAPVWFAFNQRQDEVALNAYRYLLARLNERRDVWRSAYPAPMFIVLPESFRAQIAGLIPDLWSIRVLAERLNTELLQPETRSRPPVMPVVTLDADTTPFPIPSFKQALIEEWLRLEGKDNPTVGAVRAGQRAVQVLLEYRSITRADSAAAKILAWSRQLAKTNTPEALRDLSVSLNMVGQVSQQQGRWSDAQLAYEESLDIRRRLKAMLGETPEALRDLSVSLDNVGKVSQQQGRWNDAQSAYEESLGIRRRLCVMLGDTPESLRDLAVSLSKIGGLLEEQGQGVTPYYQEGLAIGERLATMLPDLPDYIMVQAFFQQRLDALIQKSTQ